MLDSNIYTFAVPIARAIAALVLAVLLGIVGGWIAITINAFAGFSWSPEVYRNTYLVGIGLGAGAGGYLAWMDLTPGWFWIVVGVAVVLMGGVAGSFAGYAYGRVAEESYMGRAYTIDSHIHLGAALGGFGVATILGVFREIRTLGR